MIQKEKCTFPPHDIFRNKPAREFAPVCITCDKLRCLDSTRFTIVDRSCYFGFDALSRCTSCIEFRTYARTGIVNPEPLSVMLFRVYGKFAFVLHSDTLARVLQLPLCAFHSTSPRPDFLSHGI